MSWFSRKDDDSQELDITVQKGMRQTGKLPRLEEKREGSVPVAIDPFEPRMPVVRSLEKLKQRR